MRFVSGISSFLFFLVSLSLSSCQYVTFKRPSTLDGKNTPAKSPARLPSGSVAPILTLSETDTFDFGSVRLGESSTHVFTLSNTGNAPAAKLAGALSHPSNQFAGGFPGYGGTCPTSSGSLAVNATCKIVVTFTPPAVGTYLGNKLEISYSDGSSQKTVTRLLSGAGIGFGILALSETDPFDFGTVQVGDSNVHLFTLSNIGTAPADRLDGALSDPNYTFIGGFPGTGGSCPATGGSLAVNGTCTIAVTFAPITRGIYSGKHFDVSYFDGLAQQTATRKISGTGIGFGKLTLSETDPFDFGRVRLGESGVNLFTLTNAGTAPADNIVAALNDPNYTFPGGFPGTGGTCPAAGGSLAMNASCKIAVAFAPLAAGTYPGKSLKISYSDSSSPQTVTRLMSGTGVGAGKLTLSETDPFDFGKVRTGESLAHVFTLSNLGTASADKLAGALNDPSFTFPGGFPGTGGSCPASGGSLAANATCTISVTFAPGAAGALQGKKFDVSYFDGFSQQTVTRLISGTGLGVGKLSFPIGTRQDFGSLYVGTESQKSISVKSTGTGPASLTASSLDSGPFHYTGGSFPGTGGTCALVSYAPDASCTLSVTFTPSLAQQNQASTLKLTFNDGSQSSTTSLGLTGSAANQNYVEILGDSQATGYGCTPFSVSLSDDDDNAINATADITVALSATGSGFFYSDKACSSATISQVTVPKGSSTASFYFRDLVEESVILSPSGTGYETIPFPLNNYNADTIVIGPPIYAAPSECARVSVQINANKDITVPLSISGSAKLYSDNHCTQPTSSATILAQRGTTAVFLSDLVKEDVLITGGPVPGYLVSTHGSTQIEGPQQLVITPPSPVHYPGNCNGPYVVKVFGNASMFVPVATDSIVNLQGNQSGFFYSDDKCTQVTSTITIPSGASQGSFYFSDALAENLLLAASLPHLTAGLAQQSAFVNPTFQLSGPTTGAGGCLELDIFSNYLGNMSYTNLPAPADTPFALSGAGGGAFFSDSRCTASTSSVTLQRGQKYVAFFYRNLATENVLITTKSATQTLVWGIANNNATKVLSPVQMSFEIRWTPIRNYCQYTQLYFLDSNQGISKLTGDISITLTSTGAEKFYSDSNCTNEISQVAALATTDHVDFYRRSSASGASLITASSAGLLPVSHLDLYWPLVALDNMGGQNAALFRTMCIPFGIQWLVPGGPPDSPISVNVTSTGSAKFFSDPNCTKPGGPTWPLSSAGAQTFYLKDDVAEDFEITTSAPGLISSYIHFVGKIQSDIEIQGPLETAGKGTMLPNFCTPYQVGFSHIPSSNNAITLASTGSATFYSDSGCKNPTTTATIPLGQGVRNITVYLMDAYSENLTLTASVPNFAPSTYDVYMNTFVDPQIVGPVTSIAGKCTGNFTISALASNRQAVKVPVDKSIDLASSGQGLFYSDSACSQVISSINIPRGLTESAIFYFKDPVSESVTTRASVQGGNQTRLLLSIQ